MQDSTSTPKKGRWKHYSEDLTASLRINEDLKRFANLSEELTRPQRELQKKLHNQKLIAGYQWVEEDANSPAQKDSEDTQHQAAELSTEPKRSWRFVLNSTNSEFMPWLKSLSPERMIKTGDISTRLIHATKYHTRLPTIFSGLRENTPPYPWPSHIKLSFTHTLDDFDNTNSRSYLDVETIELGGGRLKVNIVAYPQDAFEQGQIAHVLEELRQDYAPDVQQGSKPVLLQQAKPILANASNAQPTINDAVDLPIWERIPDKGEDRLILRLLLKDKLRVEEVASQVGYSKQTIHNLLSRLRKEKYEIPYKQNKPQSNHKVSKVGKSSN